MAPISDTIGNFYDMEDIGIEGTPPESKSMRDWDVPTAKLFCQLLCEGNSEKQAIESLAGNADSIPGLSANTIMRWRAGFSVFGEMISMAKVIRTHTYIEDIIDIADDASDDAIMGAAGPMINGKAIRRAEIMINTRKWIAGKINPRDFGDKTQMEITGKDGADLTPTQINVALIPAGSFLTHEQAVSQSPNLIDHDDDEKAA